MKSSVPAYENQPNTIGGKINEVPRSTESLDEEMDEEMWGQFPKDLLPCIFARLPFRCLFKIGLLSKPWQAHIRSLSFQLEATPGISSKWESYGPLVYSSQGAPLVAYSRMHRQWQRLFSLSYIFDGAFPSHRWQIKSIAGALLCLKQAGDPGERGILVTNPLLKSWRVLPPHGKMTPFLPAYDVIQIVRSEEKGSSAYKVISISQDSSIGDPSKNIPRQAQQLYHPQPHIRAEIYDSTTGAWTVNENGPALPISDLHNVGSVYLDGILYFTLVSSSHDSFHLLAYNTKQGSWTRIAHPHESYSLVQLVKCGSSVMVVFLSSPPILSDSRNRNFKFGPASSVDSNISESSISIYEVGPDGKMDKVSGGPVEFRGMKMVEGVSGDEESIYLQAFGRPLIMTYNVKEKFWSTLPVALASDCATNNFQKLLKMSSRYFGPCYNWTNSAFQPGLNPFVAP